MDYKKFEDLAQNYTAIPVYRHLLADTLTPVSLFLSIREGAKFPFLLESVVGGERIARYSFIGRNPYQILKFDGENTFLEKGKEIEKLSPNYFEELKKFTTAYLEPKIQDLPRLTGGAVGYSAYDTFRLVEDLPNMPEDRLDIPDAVWSFYDEIFAFDHVKHQIVLIKTVFVEKNDSNLKKKYNEAVSSLDEMEKAVTQTVSSSNEIKIDTNSVKSNITASRFEEMVTKAKEYIYEGDIFQVVLSQRFEADFSGDPFMLYRALRMVNPSPYLFFLDFNDYQLVGSSPEVLVSVQDREVRVMPIAGTRPRGKTHEEDLKYEEDLKADPKEVAEHIMLVDLGRNDVSKVSIAGTTKLERNQVIERYSHVMHIVSDVKGRLKDELNSVDALMQCFPAGTVSGAPKIRAMQIIDELEPSKRGIYAGAVGYFDFSGNMDTCIAIRTMIVNGNKAYIQAGAGIVADSVPETEFEETKNKAGALIKALSVALDI